MNHLREIRRQRGLTQLELASLARVSISTVSHAENGRVPYPAQRAAIALALDVWEEKIWPAPTR